MSSSQGIKAGWAYVELGVGNQFTTELKCAQTRLMIGTTAMEWTKRSTAADENSGMLPSLVPEKPG